MHDKLQPHQFALIKVLGDGVEDPRIENLATLTGLDQALVSAAATELSTAGHVSISEEAYTEVTLGELGEAIGRGEAELPERIIARVVRASGGNASVRDLSADGTLKAAGIQAGKFGKKLVELGWAEFAKGTLTLAGDAVADEPPSCDIEVAMTTVHVSGGNLVTDENTDERVKNGVARCKGRRELLNAKDRSRRFVTLNLSGFQLAEAIKAGTVTELREVNELTPDMLADGSWREVQFRSYDVTLSAEQVAPGKAHPLQRLVQQTREAFMALGFSEANCQMAETAFWDFDALFQPQDHPAREMQDTFYCKTPSSYPLPDEEIVERVRRTHEDGWETGSQGWRYQWSPKRAAQVVLRTHMTASSIEAIARNPKPPQKVFSIGRVFRRETVDYKHLPEFMQVDGIILDEHANFASLLGTMEAFCQRLGIPEVRFKPDFFPYTEPSAGVQVKWGDDWLELGGSGIFRPEVTLPFGCSAPVLAWGLGLERLAMAFYGVRSIKDLYQSDLDWLKSVPLSA